MTTKTLPVLTPHVDAELHVSDEMDVIMARLAEHAEVIRGSGEANERAGQPIPEVVEALHEINVFRSAVPRALGGLELSPRQLLVLMEEITSLDASTGWVVLATNVAAAATAAYVGDEAAHEYFGDGRCAILAGQGTRLGAARRVDGGYRVSGEWQFNSGAPLATVIHTGVLGDDGRALVATLPIEEVTTSDNWDVLGLRATGSHDYRIDDVFVADSHTYETTTRSRRRGGAFYAAGLANIATLHHGGWALGVTKRLLEELRTLAQAKSQRPGDSTSTDQFFAAYAEADVRYRAARALLMETWAGIEDALSAGRELTMEEESLIRLASLNAKRTAQAVATVVTTWSGTAGIRPGPIQRYVRDVQVGVQHISCNPVVLQAAGKQLLGIADPEAFWVFYQLIEGAGDQS